MANQLRAKLEDLKKQYIEVMDEINVLKADGRLSKLCNLRDQFDENFDSFFDDKVIAQKYGDWDEEKEQRLNDKPNAAIELELDDVDVAKLIEFYENYIGELEDELTDLSLLRGDD